jgi:DNA-binding response OmpR family regulator
LKKRILIVDDEPNFRLAVSVVLRKAGYEVYESKDGEDALRRILETQSEDKSYDLLLLDLLMPEMTGMELIDELNKKGISVPILIVTACTNGEIIRNVTNIGEGDILQKPFEPRELRRRIEEILDND